MTSIADLPTPALVLDIDRLEANLDQMSQRANRLGVALRPHMKTHKCVEIAERQREKGAQGITVSTLYEARVFAEHGFDDITWAFPLIHSRVDEARDLADRVMLRVTIDSLQAVTVLEREHFPFHVWLKVDSGYHRAGVDPHSEAALRIARRLVDSSPLIFDGILSHSGNAYGGSTQKARAAIAESERAVMVEFADRLRGDGIDVPAVSVGSTPAMTSVENLEGVTEVRPGNYALFDYTQVALGTCTSSQCAVTLLSSVVSSQPGAQHCVVDAGALALSKDIGPSDPTSPVMGMIYDDYASGSLSADTRLVSVSQEHGKVNAPLEVGSQLRILPNHSCLTVAQFDGMYVVRGEEVVDRWRVWNGRER